jgi:hypothetical protein
MDLKSVQRVFLAGALLSISHAAWAHHSYAMFDQTRSLTVQGTVRALEWTNPHIWVWVDVEDGKGGTAAYGFESNAPAELARFFGWNKRSLTVGEKVTIDYAPLKSGNTGGALRTLTFADGRVLRTPRSNPQYAVGPRPRAASGGGNEAK